MSISNRIADLSRRCLLGSLLALALVAPARAEQASEDRLEARARAIHARTLVLDSHVDVLLPRAAALYAGPDGKSAAELPKLIQGGVGALALAIAVGPGPRTGDGYLEARAEAAEKLASLRAFLAQNPDKVALAKSADDVLKLRARGLIAVIASFQNTRSIGKDLAEIDRYYQAGVRLFGFTHVGNNDFADSSRPVGEPSAEHRGLSALGKRAVDKLNGLGVIIDVSQLSTDALLQTVQRSKAPVVASHSAVRALVDVPRNLSDAELDAIGERGGVVQVTAFNAYLARPSKTFADELRALRQRFALPPQAKSPDEGVQALAPERQREFFKELTAIAPKASVKDLADHIDYVAKRIGVDHVGVGSDFNHGAGIQGFKSAADAPNLTRELLRRGYDEAQIGRIWGRNFLRVFRAVEAASKRGSSKAAANKPVE